MASSMKAWENQFRKVATVTDHASVPIGKKRCPDCYKIFGLVRVIQRPERMDLSFAARSAILSVPFEIEKTNALKDTAEPLC